METLQEKCIGAFLCFLPTVLDLQDKLEKERVGRTPAPVHRYFIQLFTGFCMSQVQIFFHQQYVCSMVTALEQKG